MKAFTLKFTTDKNEYDLLHDSDTIIQKLEDLGIDLAIQDYVLSKVLVIVDTPTQIKFDLNANYEDFIEDIVYDSQDYHTFHSIILKDSGVSGSITMMVW